MARTTEHVEPERTDELQTVADPVESARAAGLRYMLDDRPGITRRVSHSGFEYIAPDGEAITSERDLERIASLAIPPAWTDVWIAPSARAHLQATGRDARGRKQYRYHPRWRQVRDETKYGRMLLFGAALPRIRERVDADLGVRGLPRQKVLATVISLLEQTLIRIGNEEYARTNKSFGLTTFRNRHVEVNGSTARFHFNGKSGVKHEVTISDRRLARIVQRCQDLPGQDLFQYIDEDGNPHAIGSADVNEYLREIAGEDYTAKDFRTWAGTVSATLQLRDAGPYDTLAARKHQVVEVIRSVAAQLGNTPAVCRKCYVHPSVLDAYEAGVLQSLLAECETVNVPESPWLGRDELLVLEVLKRLMTSPNE